MDVAARFERGDGEARRALRVAALFSALFLLVALAWVATAPPADAAGRHFTSKKSIWGPVNFNGRSQFPIYSDLGAGIYQYTLDWRYTTPTRPYLPRNPGDHAYHWPAELDQAVREARKYHIRIALLVMATPPWANGGRPHNWVPNNLADYSDFLIAAAKRYPSVKLWLIWGEPTRQANFMPLTPQQVGSRSLTAEQAKAPKLYARLLDRSYGALKGVRRSNTVIGGNSFTAGDINPYSWARYLRLPNGKRPRMDLYGHNPFSGRKPTRHPSFVDPSVVDFSDLEAFGKFLDRSGVKTPSRKPLKFFLSEFFWPTDHANGEFSFHLTPAKQAEWLGAALRIAESWSRIYTLGWFSLYDDPPNGQGTEVNRGLLRHSGAKKPSYNVFRRG